MAKALATLRALGMVLVVWGILLGVGWLAGALPEGGAALRRHDDEGPVDATEPTGSDAPSAEAAPRDDGAERAATEPSGGEPPADALEAPPSAEPVAPAPPLRRFGVCAGSTRAARLVALRVFDGPTDQLVVTCDGEGAIVAVVPGDDGSAPTPFRVARLAGGASHPGATARLTDATSVDVTGDGRLDLVVALLEEDGRGHVRGGGLFLVPGNPLGALDEATRLATFAAASVAGAAVDGAGGAEVVAMNRADSFGRRPSEAWLFAGGAAPARKARLRAGQRGLAAGLVDLDRDGHVDVVTLSDDAPALHVHFGDGTGAFPRTRTLEARGGRELVVGDVDRDGSDDVLVAGDALFLALAGAPEVAALRVIEAPPDLTSVAIDDVDGDGAPDVLGISGDGVLWLRQQEGLAFDRRRLVDLPLSAGTVRALALAELDGRPGLEAAVLVRVAGEDTPWELVLLPHALDATEPEVEAQARALADAPLVLGVALR